jgi:hypothetical protein
MSNNPAVIPVRKELTWDNAPCNEEIHEDKELPIFETELIREFRLEYILFITPDIVLEKVLSAEEK